MESLNVEFVKGDIAPRYDTKQWKQLEPLKAIVTEKGMESNLPLVDFQMKDKDGNLYFFMISGRLINGLAAAIKGVNLRNHGTEEP